MFSEAHGAKGFVAYLSGTLPLDAQFLGHLGKCGLLTADAIDGGDHSFLPLIQAVHTSDHLVDSQGMLHPAV